MTEAQRKKKKEVDYEALNSGLMRIPRMKVDIARDLLDLGIGEIYELEGRSPEILFEELKAKKTNTPKDRLPWFRMAVYYAETPHPENHRLHPQAWTD